MSSALEFYFSEIYKRQRKNQEKIRRHAKITAARFNVSNYQREGGQRKIPTTAPSLPVCGIRVEILSRFCPFHPFRLFYSKNLSSCFALGFLRALFREAFTGRIRWCKDGRKGKFRRTCLLVLAHSLWSQIYNVGEEFSRSRFHRSCFENLIIFSFL